MRLGRLSQRHYLYTLILSFLVLALIYSVVTPPFESPDEIGHFSYVTHILNTRSLPVQRLGVHGEAHQPPLYYMIAALMAAPANLEDQTGHFRSNPAFMWAGRGGYDVNAGLHGSAETFPFRGRALALHLARLSSVLMGAVTVAFTVLIAWSVFPDHPRAGLLAGALVAFTPQFLFIGGSVNNDNLLTMLATLSWWQLLRTRARPHQRRQWACAGALIGAGFLAKINGGLVIGGVAGITLLSCAFERRSLKLLVEGAWIMAVMAALLSGWWFLRNHLLYGDPLGWQVYEQIFGVNLRYGALQWGDLYEFYTVQFRSFWGVFGWMNVTAPDWFYRVFGLLCLLGLLGLGVRAFRHRRVTQSGSRDRAIPILLLFVAFVVQQAYMLAVIARCNASCYQGRYIFPAIAPVMILLSWGLTGLLPRGRGKAWKWFSTLTLVVLLLGLVFIAAFVPARVIGPAYDIVPVSNWRLWLVPHKTDISFGGMFRLRGYDFDVDAQATTVVLTLYWQALQRPDFDYSAFVHLIDESDQLITQKDHAPGEARRYPPTAWWPGDIVVDAHRLSVAVPLSSGNYRFRIGLYNWITGEPLPARVEGEAAGNFVILERAVQR